jgi:hypothetical protein
VKRWSAIGTQRSVFEPDAGQLYKMAICDFANQVDAPGVCNAPQSAETDVP